MSGGAGDCERAHKKSQHGGWRSLRSRPSNLNLIARTYVDHEMVFRSEVEQVARLAAVASRAPGELVVPLHREARLVDVARIIHLENLRDALLLVGATFDEAPGDLKIELVDELDVVGGEALRGGGLGLRGGQGRWRRCGGLCWSTCLTNARPSEGLGFTHGAGRRSCQSHYTTVVQVGFSKDGLRMCFR